MGKRSVRAWRDFDVRHQRHGVRPDLDVVGVIVVLAGATGVRRHAAAVNIPAAGRPYRARGGRRGAPVHRPAALTVDSALRTTGVDRLGRDRAGGPILRCPCRSRSVLRRGRGGLRRPRCDCGSHGDARRHHTERSGARGRGRVGSRRTGERQRREQSADAVVDVRELGRQVSASAAVVEVPSNQSRVAGREFAARPAAEPVDRRSARFIGMCGEVGLEVRPPKTLPGAVCQGGHGVGPQTQLFADLRRALSLYLGAPEHGLPPHGQRRERSGRERGVQLRLHRIGPRDALVMPGHVVGDVEPAVLAQALVQTIAQGRHQVGPECAVRSTAGLQDNEDLGECLGDKIVGVRRRPGELTGMRAGRCEVPLVQSRRRDGHRLGRRGSARRRSARSTWHRQERPSAGSPELRSASRLSGQKAQHSSCPLPRGGPNTCSLGRSRSTRLNRPAVAEAKTQCVHAPTPPVLGGGAERDRCRRRNGANPRGSHL
jgi:hypothetical protein